jgi:hypothetical protein
LARTILDLIGGRDDTVDDFERAARRYYRDARALRRADRRFGAIYIYGYSVEMRIKAACFRSLFAAQAKPITEAITGDLRDKEMKKWQQLNLSRKYRGPHDIESWTRLLVARRAALPMPYRPDLARELVDQATIFDLNWREFMRYRTAPVSRAVFESVRLATLWFEKHRGQL